MRKLIYIMESLQEFNEDLIKKYLEEMPFPLREKMQRYPLASARQQGTAAYTLLCYGLKKEYGINELPVFSFNDYQKPLLPENLNIHFNLSHCKEGVVCGLSQKEIGIDIQDFRKLKSSLTKRILSPKEQEYLEMSEDKEKTLIKLWTLKEAYGKAMGLGLSYPFRETNFTKDYDEWENEQEYLLKALSHPQFMVSVCAKERLHINYLKPNDLDI